MSILLRESWGIASIAQTTLPLLCASRPRLRHQDQHREVSEVFRDANVRDPPAKRIAHKFHSHGIRNRQVD